jgi:threonine/homoserine/homoserine lactone efflux protein
VIISRSIVAFKYAAAAYLIYLGIASLQSGARTLDTLEIDGRRLHLTWFVHGFVNNLLNPKGTLFYLGMFTVVITPETSGSAMLLLIVSMMLVSASFWLCFVYTLDRPIVRQCIERSQETVHRIFGGLLILLGLRVASMRR